MYDIKHTTMTHKEGTKDYDIVEIYDQASDKFLLIKRWGKIGQVGQLKFDTYDDIGPAKAAFRRVFDTRVSRGYDRHVTSDYDHLDPDGVLNYLHNVGRFSMGPIRSQLNSFFLHSEGAVTDDLSDSFTESKVETPVERGESWGTW